MSLYWFVQAAGYLALVFFLVPYTYIRKLLFFSFTGGFLYTIAVQHTAINLLDLWQYSSTIATVWGIPLFFVLSWFAVTLLYGYFLIRYPHFQVGILILFVIFTTLNNYVSYVNNNIYLKDWSISETFMFAIFSHVVLLYFLKYLHRIPELGAHEEMVPKFLKHLINR